MIRPQPDAGEVLAGLVERVTYHNAESEAASFLAHTIEHPAFDEPLDLRT
jgi:hypothetical protein